MLRMAPGCLACAPSWSGEDGQKMTSFRSERQVNSSAAKRGGGLSQGWGQDRHKGLLVPLIAQKVPGMEVDRGFEPRPSVSRMPCWEPSDLGASCHTILCTPCWQVARRCWSGNRKAYEIICQTMQENKGLVVTLPHEVADEHMLQQALRP